MELVLQDILNDAALKDALVEIKYENHPLTSPARIGEQRVWRILGDLSVESVSINYDINKMYGLSLEEILLNYPPTAEPTGWASCFTATCLLLRRVRSLTVAPHVYSQVPYEVLMSCTDSAKILNNFTYQKVVINNLKRGSRIPPIEPLASMGFLLQFYEIQTK